MPTTVITRRALAGLLFVALAIAVAGCGRNAPEEGAPTLEASVETTTTLAPVTTAGPTTEAPPPTQPSYVIQEGDSLSLIAQRFGVATDALADFNGIENPNDIQVGQTLTIPPTTVAPSE